ncbi:hypothetical protein T492DRAFT_1057397 [Pavlovales sp. CCMP2436]|nr:hypothetical protein T492DRAFT_1057397 [Pavlovales sp. CCMP2436]
MRVASASSSSDSRALWTVESTFCSIGTALKKASLHAAGSRHCRSGAMNERSASGVVSPSPPRPPSPCAGETTVVASASTSAAVASEASVSRLKNLPDGGTSGSVWLSIRKCARGTSAWRVTAMAPACCSAASADCRRGGARTCRVDTPTVTPYGCPVARACAAPILARLRQ